MCLTTKMLKRAWQTFETFVSVFGTREISRRTIMILLHVLSVCYLKVELLCRCKCWSSSWFRKEARALLWSICLFLGIEEGKEHQITEFE